MAVTVTTIEDIEHEYDDHGNHRLRYYAQVGLWTTYQSIAEIEIHKTQILCATDFWEPTFQADKPFMVVYYKKEVIQAVPDATG